MKHIFLSVVIPCYDEMANLQKGVLDKIEHFLHRKKISYEVIIVDDGSGDGSIEFVEEFIKDSKNFKLIKNEHTGKAGAVTKGMLESKGDIILFTDMDQATPIEEIEKLLPYFDDAMPALPAGRQGYDVVIGSRNSERKGSPIIRAFVSRAAIILRKYIVGMGDIADTQCGFKAFKRDAAQKIFTKIKQLHHGFHAIHGSSVTSGFDVEVLFLAMQMGYRIKEVPIRWLYVETRRVNVVKDSIDGVLDLIRIRYNRIKGLY